MKIAEVKTWIVRIPSAQPFAGINADPNTLRPFVALRIRTDDGVEGIGLSGMTGAMTRALAVAVDDLSSLIVGDDPLSIEAIRAKLYAAGALAGPDGLFTLAIAAIDIALWDIKAKALNLPLWRLLGGFGKSVPAYVSGALTRDLSDDEVARAAQAIVDGGFTQAKMQLALPGLSSAPQEIQRARLVRDAVGPDFQLMADINQRWRIDQAIAIGQQLEPFNFTWLEDVAAASDFTGLARVASALTTPLTCGEKLWGLAGFRQMIEARAADIVMIDLFRVGGISPWLKVAAMAEAFNLPVVSHLAPEIHVHLIGAIPNGLTVEYMPWTCRLFDAVPLAAKGMLSMPEDIGLGLTLDDAVLRRFAVTG